MAMRTILVFNDDSSEAINAADFASHIALKVKADILTLNLTKRKKPRASKALIGAGFNTVGAHMSL
jgi:hypothetical protein